MEVVDYILEKLPGSSFNNTGRLHTHCPFHNDNSPSFSINEEGLFICGSPLCGVRGNFMQFYKLMEGITSWSEVYRKFESFDRRISTDVETMLGLKKKPDRNKLQINKFPTTPFVKPIIDTHYARDRGLSLELLSYFGVVYGTGGEFDKVDITNSLVAPIYDYDGNYLSFQARRLGISKQRWQHPSGSPSSFTLYGCWLINDRTKYLWIVEGGSDVWKLTSFDEQAVGLFTKEATDRQINLIRKLCKQYNLIPVVCMDGDAKSATTKIYLELAAFGLPAIGIYLDDDEDPGGLSGDRFNELKGEFDHGESGRTKNFGEGVK